jgi:6-pyruvoyl-tetrahydropterin synthase
MIFDFKDIKPLKKRIDNNRDHAYIHQQSDPIGEILSDQGMKTFSLPTPPSSENLAKTLYEKAHELNIPAHSIELFETEKCSVVYP